MRSFSGCPLKSPVNANDEGPGHYLERWLGRGCAQLKERYWEWIICSMATEAFEPLIWSPRTHIRDFSSRSRQQLTCYCLITWQIFPSRSTSLFTRPMDGSCLYKEMSPTTHLHLVFQSPLTALTQTQLRQQKHLSRSSRTRTIPRLGSLWRQLWPYWRRKGIWGSMAEWSAGGLGCLCRFWEWLFTQRQVRDWVQPREDDLREGFPVPYDNVLKSINSFAPCCESYLYFLVIEAPTSRYSNWPIR